MRVVWPPVHSPAAPVSLLPQAKTLGDELVVGLVPDREILRCKVG